MKSKYARRLMNNLGRNHTPFLFIIDFKVLNPLVYRLDEINSDEILFKINTFYNYNNIKILTKEITFKKYPIQFNTYRKAFEKVIRQINAGNTYLLNLTFPTRIKTNLSLKEIFYNSRAKYKIWFKDKFVVFSPETFVKIKDGKITSFPMKGTIDASLKNARTKIIKDRKELAEHTTIVDLIRNDLSMVAKKVHVEKFRYIEKIRTHEKNLLQVSSRITGSLPNNYQEKIGDIMFSLLPAGSISGAPKHKTVEIIKKVEKYNRGYYTGILGFYDGTNLDSAVMIRYIENQKGNLIFKSGGGITNFSDARKEYQELIDKVYVPIV